MTYTLCLDVAGLATNTPARLEIGKAGSWRELRAMAKGAAPLEGGGRLHAISEDNRVLYMADLRMDHDPHIGANAGEDLDDLHAAREVALRRGYPVDLLDSYIKAVDDELIVASPRARARSIDDNVRRHERVMDAMGRPGAVEG